MHIRLHLLLFSWLRAVFNRGCHARDRVIYLFLIIIYSKSRKLNFFLLIISICFNGMDLSYFIIAPKNVVVMFTELGFVSGGVCDECMHNTQGKNCEQCKPFYYRNPQRPITDPYVCLPCECDKVCCWRILSSSLISYKHFKLLNTS